MWSAVFISEDYLSCDELDVVAVLDELAGVKGGLLGLPAAARGRLRGQHDAGKELKFAVFSPNRD